MQVLGVYLYHRNKALDILAQHVALVLLTLLLKFKTGSPDNRDSPFFQEWQDKSLEISMFCLKLVLIISWQKTRIGIIKIVLYRIFCKKIFDKKHVSKQRYFNYLTCSQNISGVSAVMTWHWQLMSITSPRRFGLESTRRAERTKSLIYRHRCENRTCSHGVRK